MKPGSRSAGELLFLFSLSPPPLSLSLSLSLSFFAITSHSLSLFHTECLSEGVKLLKAEYLVKAIRKHKMDQAIIFCRTKLDCDNIERYLMKIGGGGCG